MSTYIKIEQHSLYDGDDHGMGGLHEHNLARHWLADDRIEYLYYEPPKDRRRFASGTLKKCFNEMFDQAVAALPVAMQYEFSLHPFESWWKHLCYAKNDWPYKHDFPIDTLMLMVGGNQREITMVVISFEDVYNMSRNEHHENTSKEQERINQL